jgi:2-keto-4-pentenoate hydratase/2-oxohepta-3-ene-1,7-dioic acid hydratase in catechol pathway
MRLATVRYQAQEEVVGMTERGPVRLARLAEQHGASPSGWNMERVLAGGPTLWAEIGAWLAEAQAQQVAPDPAPDEWLAPVPRPGKILCVGLNYRPHVQESGETLPTTPLLFNKYANAVRGTGAIVRPPSQARQVDYEAELVVVIGRRGYQIPEQQALNWVFGYCNGNDLSARDLQFRTSQWLLGKTPDGFAPMGPYVVTADEVPDPNQLDIVGRRNGVVVQRANTRDMIFSCAYLISYISQFITLEPGDVIFTGTPEGVILGQPEHTRRWLEAGEQFTVAIEGLGELVTTIGS